VKGTISGQNVTIDLRSKEACSDLSNLVTGIQANGASISPDPRTPRDYSQPVVFTLTAPDGTKTVFTVTVIGNGVCTTPTPAPAPSPVPTPSPTPTPTPVATDLAMTSAAALGTFTLGNTFTKTVEFDATLAAATITGLPSGVTASAPVLSGKTATFTLIVNPLVFAFASAAQSIGFTVSATGASSPAKDFSVTATVNDVAPNFAALGDVTRDDNTGTLLIAGICPTVADQFGRTVTCAVVISETSGAIAFGLTYDATANNIVGDIDAFGAIAFQIRRSIRAVNGIALQITDSILTINDVI
jgi:hypothetical protein